MEPDCRFIFAACSSLLRQELERIPAEAVQPDSFAARNWILAAGVLLATKKYRKHGAFLLAGLAVGVLAGNLTLKPLIAFSRLYLYVPFPTDILGAAVLGMAIGLLTCIIGDKIWTALAKKGVFLRAR